MFLTISSTTCLTCHHHSIYLISPLHQFFSSTPAPTNFLYYSVPPLLSLPFLLSPGIFLSSHTLTSSTDHFISPCVIPSILSFSLQRPFPFLISLPAPPPSSLPLLLPPLVEPLRKYLEHCTSRYIVFGEPYIGSGERRPAHKLG